MYVRYVSVVKCTNWDWHIH